jgi:peptidylprolyl isomerase
VAPKAAGAGAATARVKRLVRGVGTRRTSVPKVRSPGGTPPARLVQDDRVLCGAGARARTGSTVEVRYTVHLWRGKRGAVDSSWTRTPQTASFVLTKRQLIDGWVEGIRGMRVGSRRVLVIPPSKAYGKTGTGDGGVPAGATLISVIDLVAVSST